MNTNTGRKLVWPAWHGARVWRTSEGYVWQRDDAGHLPRVTTPEPELHPRFRCVPIHVDELWTPKEADDGNG